MRPGKPLMFGQLGRQLLLGLPGNPVSALVCAVIFLARPIARMLLGRRPAGRPGPPTLAAPLPANDQRQDYLRATLELGPGGKLIARPISAPGLVHARVFAKADCLVIRPPHAPAAETGCRSRMSCRSESNLAQIWLMRRFSGHWGLSAANKTST